MVEKFLRSREYLSIDKEGMPVPDWLTLRDRLKLIIRKRKAYNAKQIAANGVEEDEDDLSKMLDGMIDDIGVKKKDGARGKEERSALADALKSAGEGTRAMATRSREEDDEDTPRTKKTKNMFSFDKTSNTLADTIERQLKVEEEKNKLKKERLERATKQIEYMREQNANLMKLLGDMLAKG